MIAYKFGLLPPHEGRETWDRLAHEAHRYRNDLIRVERERISAERSIVAELGGEELEREVDACQARLAAAKAARDAGRVASRSKRDAADVRAEYEAARAALKAATERRKEARRGLRLAAKEQIGGVRARAKLMEKGARALSRVAWLAKDAAEERHEAAVKKLRATGELPAFRRWTGEATLYVRRSSPGGLTPSDYAVLDLPLPKGADPTSKRSAKRRHVELSLCFSGQWIRWRAVLHRPVTGTVLRVSVSCRKVGMREKWSASFITTADAAKRCGVGTIGVDIGWRVEPDGSRRALTWHDGERGGIVRMPAEVASGLAKAESLRAIRDRSREGLAAAVAGYLRRNGVPEWATRDVEHMHAWKSAERLHRFAREWIRRCPGDMGAMMLEAWRYHDQHLWAWEADQRRKSCARRLDWYRNEAARLAATYERIAIEGDAHGVPLDLSRMARAKVAGGGRVEASPGEARAALIAAFGGMAGGRVVVVPAAGTSSTCHACGGRLEMEPGRVEYDCPTCGAEIDRDDNAARNIRERGMDLAASQEAERWVAREAAWMAAE